MPLNLKLMDKQSAKLSALFVIFAVTEMFLGPSGLFRELYLISPPIFGGILTSLNLIREVLLFPFAVLPNIYVYQCDFFDAAVSCPNLLTILFTIFILWVVYSIVIFILSRSKVGLKVIAPTFLAAFIIIATYRGVQLCLFEKFVKSIPYDTGDWSYVGVDLVPPDRAIMERLGFKKYSIVGVDISTSYDTPMGNSFIKGTILIEVPREFQPAVYRGLRNDPMIYKAYDLDAERIWLHLVRSR